MSEPTPAAGEPPAWLPSPVAFTGDWFAYVEDLYERYLAAFVRNRAYWRGKPVWVDIEPLVSGKHVTFWHIISGIDPKTKDLKDPNLERSARLCWVRPILEAGEGSVRTWIQPERGSVVVALPDFSYLVILRERADKVFLKSAYYVERPGRREQYRKQHEASEKR